MTRTTVSSAAVQSIGYEHGILEVEIHGRLYACEATEAEYDAFMAAPSKGLHLQSFRGRLKRVDPEPEDAPTGGTDATV